MYSRLPTEINEEGHPELLLLNKRPINARSILVLFVKSVCFGLLLLWCFILGRWSVTLNECGKRLSTWCKPSGAVNDDGEDPYHRSVLTTSLTLAPALESLDYHQTMLDVSVYNSLSESKFRGPPSDELDAAWDSIANQDQYIMRIAKQNLPRINRTDAERTAFGWEGDSDGVRMIPEVFHELHCLVSSH